MTNAGVIIKDPGPFKVLYNLPKGINLVICMGGRGGRKTYEVSKFIAKSATIEKKRCAVLRDEKESISQSILNEIFQRYDTANEYGHFDGLYDKIDTGIRDKKTKEMLVFTKGFRASSKDKKSNLKGISDVDIAIIEEAEDIRSFQKFNTFKDSMRKPGRLIIIMLNTPDINHWVVQKYFNLEPVLNEEGTGTGYFKCVPKKIEGFLAIQTNYTDNPFLPADVVRDYKGYGDPKSHLYDIHYYYKEILGYASSGRRGQILTKVKPISLLDYIKLPYKEIYGLDFGTSSPAGLVGVKIHRNTSWCRQINYLPKDTLGIGIMLSELGFTKEDRIIADSAAPIDISKLSRGWKREELTAEQAEKYPQLLKGFFTIGAIKGPGSITSGVNTMKGMELYAVEESTDLWTEIRNWIYQVDRFDQPTNEPVDDNNHLIDPWRYVITGRGRLY